MKLGDNMTTEAYNIWSDVPQRKCRPPKIGDIPKHSAIDEESPSSISKSLTVVTTDPRDSTLDISLDTSRNIVFPLPSNASVDQFSSIRRFDPESTRSSSKESIRFQYPPVTKKEHCTLNILNTPSRPLQQSFRPLISKLSLDKETEQKLEKFTDLERTLTTKLSPEKSTTSVIKIPEDSIQISSSPEDISNQEIVEVRKDSALFLEEAEGLPTLREILKARAPRVIRPRRESSGYASNLGTFDEDRRNSSTGDALPDLSTFLKERRRSSTGPKRVNSRVILARADGSLTKDVEVERMPTTEIHTKVSGPGPEMPNIEEVKEVLRDEIPSRQGSLDNICSLIKNISYEDISTRCRHLRDRPNIAISSKSSPEILNSPFHQDATLMFDTSPLGDSFNRLSISPPMKSPTQTIYHRSISLTSSSSFENITKLINKSEKLTTLRSAQVKAVESSRNRIFPVQKERETVESCDKNDVPSNVLPRSIKMYQLLSTQSEDTIDDQLHFDRRIAFQVSKQDDESARLSSRELRNKPLNKSSSVFTLKTSAYGDIQTLTSAEPNDDTNIRKAISPGDVGTSQRFLGDSPNVSVRPIYPNCPYSPYGSPQGSPRNRRRPLRESRRVSIDNRQGALQLNQYKLLDNIGQGSYGIVKLAYNEEDEIHYAMKILSKKKLMKKAGIFGRMAPGRKGSANPLVKVYREIALLKKLDHPNVVKLVEVLDDPDEDNLYLVFELVQRGEILQVPTDKPLDEETARKNFRDVVLGVEYLHYQRIVHRDIKPSNLLVDSEGRIKIADLGVSAELRACGELLSGPAGTPAFAAPETTTPGAHYSGTLCDVWSMGVTLYCLVTGRIPWDGAGSVIGVQAAARTEPLKFTEKPALSKDLCDLISKMLAKDPRERISLAEIKKHAWLTNHGAEPLPSEADNCRLPVTVTDEEVERVVTRIPKLDTLILIKTMLKQHSFQNPFLPKKSSKSACNDAATDSMELSPSGRGEEALPGRKTIRNAKTERFQRTGRSNSAPDSYDWQINGRQLSVDNPLPPVTEASIQEAEIERR